MNKMPMKIDDVLDDIVLIVLDGHEPLKELGVDQNKIYVKVVGYDEYGMWIDRPSFQIPIINNVNWKVKKKFRHQCLSHGALLLQSFISQMLRALISQIHL